MRRFLLLLAICALPAGTAPAALAADSRGTDFWLGFPAAEDPLVGSPAHRLLITAPVATEGAVSVPGTAFNQGFAVVPGGMTTVDVPAAVEHVAADTVAAGKGIHVTAGQPVAVQAVYEVEGLTDGYLALPTSLLGTSYRVLDYPGNVGCGEAEFEIVGTQAATTVTVTPSTAIGSHPAGVPYNLAIGAGSTYLGQATGTGSTSGTEIVADKPIAVLAGNSCGQVPVGATAANFLVEQMPPVSAWGTDFSVQLFAGRTSGDQLTLLGSTAGTAVAVSAAGGPPPGAPTTLSAGQSVSFAIDEPVRIVADKPILVAHFAEGWGEEAPGAPNPTGDPTMTLVPPRERWAYSQTVGTPPGSFSQRYLNLVIGAADLASLRLDGSAVATEGFTPVVGDPTLLGGRLAVGAGAHALTAAGPFAMEVYGFGDFDAFGWAGAWGDGARAPQPAGLPPSTSLPAGGGASAPLCRVPKLKRKRLPAVRKSLRRSGCRLGRVKKLAGATAKSGRVARQRPSPGKALPEGAKIAVTLKED